MVRYVLIFIVLFCGQALAQSGRLTLQNGHAVQSTPNLVNGPSLYYTCTGRNGDKVSIRNGTQFVDVALPGCQVGTDLSPAVLAQTLKGYAVFMVLNQGVPKICVLAVPFTVGTHDGN